MACLVDLNVVLILLRHVWLSYSAAVLSICLPLPSSFGFASAVEVGLLERDAAFFFWFAVKVGV